MHHLSCESPILIISVMYIGINSLCSQVHYSSHSSSFFTRKQTDRYTTRQYTFFVIITISIMNTYIICRKQILRFTLSVPICSEITS